MENDNAPPKPKRQWWEVLGVAETASLAVVSAVYRELAKKAHPDAGGDRAAWDELVEAYERAKEELAP